MGKKYKPACTKELKELLEKDVRLGDIDTSLITDMTELFRDSMRKNFDGLETWDTSNVTTMKGMFYRAKYFNHPIGDWDVSKVEDMSYMFCEAPAFNQPLEKWDVSNVQRMDSMFAWAYSFNQPIERWNVSNVYNMKAMLHFAKSFNQPLNGWDMSGVGTIWAMFAGAKSFNQPLDKWDTSSISEMQYAFSECYEFNQNIDSWDTSNVEDMDGMFDGAKNFNQPLNSWKTGKVRFMRRMFQGASSFDQPLDKWDVSRVETAEMMFKNATSFSQPLDMWQISRDCDVNEMFLDAPRFADVKILTLNFAHTNKMEYREYLKEVLGRFDAAQVYAELSLYGDKYTAAYKRELEAAHPELKGSVRASAGTEKHKPRSKAELIELLNMGMQIQLDTIDTSCITDMEGLFKDSQCRDFIGIETWDTCSTGRKDSTSRWTVGTSRTCRICTRCSPGREASISR